jgi:serine/alanine adding enzyme
VGGEDWSHYPDVYFTPGYGWAVTDAGAGETWLGLERLGGAWQMPLIVRPLADGWCDATSPYGYAGAWVHAGVDPHDAAAVWPDVLEELRDRRFVSVFLRHSPVVPQAPLPPGARTVVSGHPTRLLDVRDPDRTWADMKGACRTSIRKADKVGAAAEIRPATRADLDESAPFHTLYAATMRRRGAAPAYFFPQPYYGRLLDALGANLLIGVVRNRDGSVIASSLLMLHGPFLHYHLSGTSAEGADCGATNLLLWTACQSAPAYGASLFHLGGGVAPRDPLYRFKASFGGRDVEFRASGLIVNRGRYDQMTSHLPTPPKDFFPAYRATA